MNIKLLDISSWQLPSKINYARIAEQVDGVILRGAYGIWADTRFEEHYNNFIGLNVPLGAYHFIVNFRGAREQADVFKAIVKDHELKLGYWADVELEVNTEPLTKRRVNDYMRIVTDEISEFGIYTSRSMWDSIMGNDEYLNHKLWIAHYGVASPSLPATGGWKSWWLWQFTSSYKLDGYDGSLDMSYFWGEAAEFNDWVGNEIVAPIPDPEQPIYKVEIINCTYLNVRNVPYVNNNIVGYLTNGDIVSVYKEQTGWLKIDNGWISAAYTKIVEEIEPPDYTLEEKVERLWAAHPELH